MAELQKDRMTRSDFLGFGLVGTVMGALLTIPPAAFLLGPNIKTQILGQSDVTDEWQAVGPVSEVGTEEPVVFRVDFPVNQTYGERDVQEESGVTDKEFFVTHAIWLSWRTEVNDLGKTVGEAQRPSFLDQKTEGFTDSEIQEVTDNLNVLSNSCAHLGCPVRWVIIEGSGEFLCPCHGGIYDINGDYVAGPPPRGMYQYEEREVREDGILYVKREFDVDQGIPAINTTEPYVI